MSSQGSVEGSRTADQLVKALTLLNGVRSKVSDKKRGADILLSLIDEDETIRLLDTNSLLSKSMKAGTGSFLTWDAIFRDCRTYCESEISKKNPNMFAFSMLQTIVKKANQTRPYLSLKDLFEFIMTRLGSERLNDTYEHSLFQMLKSVLSTKLYASLLSPNSWERVLDILIELFRKTSISKTVVLEILNMVIINGSNHPEVILCLRNKLVKFYHEMHQNPMILSGVVLLCQHNAIEFRGILCKLGERIIPYLISHFSAATYDMENTVNLFLIQMKLHSPYDVDSTSEAFYAADPAKWEDCVMRIYSFATDAIDEIAKKSGYSKNVTVSKNLLTLAVKATQQIHCKVSRSEEPAGGEGFPPSKRPMVYRSFQSILNDTAHLQPSETLIVWLQYVTAVLDSYPAMAETSATIEKLFKMGLSLLGSAFVVREEVYAFFRCLLYCEKHLLKKRVLSERSSSWNHVWDITIKSLTVNEAKPEALEFLRVLLIEIQPPNLNSLLLLFVNSSITPSQATLLLLSEYLARCSFPQYVTTSPTGFRLNPLAEDASKSCPRHALMKWLVTSVMDQSVPNIEMHLAILLSSLVVNRTFLFIHTEFVEENPFVITEKFRIHYDEFEELILKSCFVHVPTQTKVTTRIKSKIKIEDRGLFTVVPTAANQLMELLQHDFHQLPPIDIKNHDFTKKLIQLQYRVNILINMYNIMEKHELGEPVENHEFKAHLLDLFEKAFHRYINIVSEFLSQPKELSNQISYKLIKIMRNVFSNKSLCDKVKMDISKQYSHKIKEFWKATFLSGLPQTAASTSFQSRGTDSQGSPTKDLFRTARALSQRSGADEDDALSEQRVQELACLEALRCLIDFAFMYIDRKQELLADLIEHCQKIGDKQLNVVIQFHFDLCEELILQLIPAFSTIRPLHKSITLLLQSLCRYYNTSMDCTARLWDIFAQLGPSMARESDTLEHHQYCMILVGALISKMEKSGIKVIKAAFKTLSVYAQNDPWFQWTAVLMKSDGSLKSIFINLPHYLRNPSQEIRTATVNFFCEIFRADSLSPHSSLELRFPEGCLSTASARRMEIYEEVYTTLRDVYNVPPGFQPDEVAEEAVNRTSTVLSCLTRIIFFYPFGQKRALFCLFLTVELKSISVALTCRALKYAQPDSTKTMSYHILYVLEKWFKQRLDINDLPYQFYDCESKEEFFLKYKREIGFQCFLFCEGDNTKFIQQFATALGTSVIELVKECYGMIMGRLCVGLGTTIGRSDTSLSLIKQHSVFLQSQTRLIRIFGGKSLTETHGQTLASLGEIILNVISITFDPTITEKWNCPEIRLSDPEPPHYDEPTVEAGLEYLKQCLSFPVPTVIGYLVRTSPKQVYGILLSLVQRIHKSHDYLEKFWRLHHFSFFIRLLLAEPRDVFTSMRQYVCQFTVYSYLRLLSNRPEESSSSLQEVAFIRAVIHVLTEFVQTLTRLSPEEMSDHYRPIVSQLIAVFMKTPNLTATVTTLLDFLLKTSGTTFQKCIVSLDPFPSDIEAFTEYRELHADGKYGTLRNEWALDQELQNCLDQTNAPHSHGTCTKERLRFLKQLLSQRKFDLEVLVKVMGGKKFSDECSKDVIHNLIQMLIGVIITSQDEEITLEACRCLGEIGPIDLSVLVLPQYGQKPKIASAGTAVLSIIEAAAEYLISEDIDLVATTGQVLESMLQIKVCSDAVKKELVKSNPGLAQILTPFMSEAPTAGVNISSCSPTVLEAQLNRVDSNEFISFVSWVTELTCGLIKSIRPVGSYLEKLLLLCRLKVNFCQEVLPFVVYVCLMWSRNNPVIRKLLSSYFTKFFSNFNCHRRSSSQPIHLDTPQHSQVDETTQNSIYTNKLALRCLLRVVHFLRLHTVPEELIPGAGPPGHAGTVARKTPWDNNFWLDVNYLDLAKAAQFCGAYLTSILYSEIYASASSDDCRAEGASLSQYCSYGAGASQYSRPRSQSAEIEKLLLKAYTSIGEPDAVYGCGSARYSDFQSNVQHLQQMNQWNRALAAYDADTSNRHNSPYGVCISMKELGLFNSLWTYMQGYEHMHGKLEPDLSEIQYECGWRLSKWDLNWDKATYVKHGLEDLTNVSTGYATIQKSIYESIQGGLNNDRLSHHESIQAGFKSIVKDLRHASLESAENLYTFLTQFQMFRIIEDFFSTRETGEPIEQLLNNWNLQDKLGCSDLKFQEQILFLRSILLKSFDEQQSTPSVINSYDDCMLQLLTQARICGRLELAENCTSKIIGRARVPRKELEIAKNHWARGEQDIAQLILGRIIKKSTPDMAQDLYATSLLLYGEWLCETKGERPNVILDQYFFQSVKLYENKKAFGTAAEISKAHITLAKYADSLYQNISVYCKSEMFQEKIRTLERIKLEQEQLKTSSDPDARKSYQLLQKQIQLDTTEVQTTYSETKRFLIYALTHYLRGLKFSTQNDLLIFRAIGLWLDNIKVPETTKIIQDEVLPSYKYVVVLHQLTARMGSANGVGDVLDSILMRCAKDHPYHTLPVLMAQALMHKDKEFVRGGPTRKPIENDRVLAARRLVENLKKTPTLGELVQKTEQVWTALISLANLQETKNTENTRREIPATSQLRRLKGMDIVPVPTMTIAVSPSSKYKDFVVGIHSFNVEYIMVGGINSPKKISCIGTDGLRHNMLLKGQDDLRQDAVMQQVFAVMNKLLYAEPATRARRLQIRTYKVVPLSQRSGIIEWCENTQTFGDYLVGSQSDPARPGAHRLYRPQDYSPPECRRKLMAVKDCGNNTKKLEVYTEVMAHFKPVFRHFFFENFMDAGTYFERRLAYTRSVATSSMVGYVLGLGDRHVLNILVDKNTAEFIHIDLGVAFEQGRLLPTPETIPFRLSRDVVDGMGVCGVEGDFRCSCEMTLEVLRSNSEIILTILEVLLYDPLYMWTLSADRMQKVQPGDSGRGRKLIALLDNTLEEPPKERNSSAARVLLRLKQKLIGVEEGLSSGSTLSVPGHVSLLIQRAMDPERLSRLFSGWQPYL